MSKRKTIKSRHNIQGNMIYIRNIYQKNLIQVSERNTMGKPKQIPLFDFFDKGNSVRGSQIVHPSVIFY